MSADDVVREQMDETTRRQARRQALFALVVDSSRGPRDPGGARRQGQHLVAPTLAGEEARRRRRRRAASTFLRRTCARAARCGRPTAGDLGAAPHAPLPPLPAAQQAPGAARRDGGDAQDGAGRGAGELVRGACARLQMLWGALGRCRGGCGCLRRLRSGGGPAACAAPDGGRRRAVTRQRRRSSGSPNSRAVAAAQLPPRRQQPAAGWKTLLRSNPGVTDTDPSQPITPAPRWEVDCPPNMVNIETSAQLTAALAAAESEGRLAVVNFFSPECYACRR